MSKAVAMFVHPERPDALEKAREMAEWFRGESVPVFFPQQNQRAEDCRMVMTFGGDGTLLAGARIALEYGCPLMGVNLGTMGFLTEGDPDQMRRMFRAVLEERYQVEKRALLRVTLNDGKDEMLALNDAVVTRGGFARLIQVETFISGEHWGTFVADGVIAATPTGSTGYSLSAGGPVIAPGVECLSVTPVCAHSLQHCPCIVPRDAEILFHLKKGRDQQAELQIDGRSTATLRAGDTVRVTGAENVLHLARIQPYRFFTVLQSKLNEWGSAPEETNP